MAGRPSRAVPTGDSPLVFVGEVSLDNNGGFASIRTAPQQHDLAGATGIVLRVRGDGKRYRVNLRTDATFDGIQYQAGFITVDTSRVGSPTRPDHLGVQGGHPAGEPFGAPLMRERHRFHREPIPQGFVAHHLHH